MAKTRTDWTIAQIAILKDLYENTLNSELAVMIGVTESAINAKAHKVGLRKSTEFMAFHAKKGQFKPGQEPPNKGKPMPPDVYEKAKWTMFKKGNLPHNTRENGEISTRPDKSGNLYRFIRKKLGVWIPYSHYVWEQHNGKLPKGMVVWHIDKDTLNDDVENLELITKQESLSRNHNREKFSETMKSKYAAGEVKNNPMINQADYMVAAWIAPKNKALQDKLLNHPEIIELKRNQIKLRKQCQQ